MNEYKSQDCSLKTINCGNKCKQDRQLPGKNKIILKYSACNENKKTGRGLAEIKHFIRFDYI
jgi:hypothetical protein